MLVKQVKSSYIIVLLNAHLSRTGDVATLSGTEKLREQHMQIYETILTALSELLRPET